LYFIEELEKIKTITLPPRQINGSSYNNTGEVVQKEWRRGQDSNLHSLSAGGFQDRRVGLNLIQPPRIYQYKSGCAAIKVIEVMVGSFPSARHLSANFSAGQQSSMGAFIEREHTRKRVCLAPQIESPNEDATPN